MTTLPVFDELNNIRTEISKVVLGTDVDWLSTRRRCEDMIFELITMGYVYGIEVAGLDLEADIPVSTDRMREVTEKRTAGETFRQRVDTHFREFEETKNSETLINQLAVIAETETHRAINTGEQDGADYYADEHPKETLFKQWVTMGDDRVRDTHDYLEGAIVPKDARFYTYDGDSARFPGDFVKPENNCGCRCVTRWVKE